jgi:nitrogen fixation protein FixH
MALRNSELPAAGAGKPLSGWHVLAILLTAFVVMLLANGALVYIATDGESDFRALIEALC